MDSGSPDCGADLLRLARRVDQDAPGDRPDAGGGPRGPPVSATGVF